MAASMSQVVTPRKSNCCVICGLSFIATESSEDGTKVVVKNFDKKLKLNPERRRDIENVVEDLITVLGENGVCRKCFRAVERVVKLEKDALEAKNSLKQSFKTTMCMPAKRMLRSLNVALPYTKSQKVGSVNVKVWVVTPVKIAPFRDLTNRSDVRPSPPTRTSRRSLGLVFSQGQQTESSLVLGPLCHAEVLSEEDKGLQDESSQEGYSLHPAQVSPKKAKSQQTSRKTCIVPPIEAMHGEVEMSVFHPSGVKTGFIHNDCHKQICKAVLRGQNVEQSIVTIISKSHPEHIIETAAKLTSEECKALCKRGSGSILQDKSFDGIFGFTWDKFRKECCDRSPYTLQLLSSMVGSNDSEPDTKKYLHTMETLASALHGRSLEMSSIQYQIGFILTHGGCKQRDIERLTKMGLCTSTKSIQDKLLSWEMFLDAEVMDIKEKWCDGGLVKYQLIGDNWDKNILPSYRTSQSKTVSLHLFNMYVAVDRIQPTSSTCNDEIELKPVDFIPSVEEQSILLKELTFIVASSVIKNIEQIQQIFRLIYPTHLQHKYSEQAGLKTKQYPIGLFDCNETKTQDVIRLLKELTKKYVPVKDGEIVEEVFLGGDRLTDERIQGAQQAMANAATGQERLQGFISKIEDWHRMMNFMEAIAKLTYNTTSAADRGTAYFFRNILNSRNVKGEVKNSFRAYKHLYYTIFDGICCVLFLREFGKTKLDDQIEFPSNFEEKSDVEKNSWLNEVCQNLVLKWFFEDSTDIVEEVRSVCEDPNHPENYWVANIQDGRFPCHFCEKRYAFVGTLKAHEFEKYGHSVQNKNPKKSESKKDELHNYILLLFKLTALLQNLDTSINMADGERAVRSAKYELPIFNKTHKTKYVIGAIHLIALAEETLMPEQRERFVANRCVNIQGGKNNNMALDEYLEMLNRDSKEVVKGNQTKESIIMHSRQFPHLMHFVQHFDAISEVMGRKGFHKHPNYRVDVEKVAKELISIDALTCHDGRTLRCRQVCTDRNPYINSYKGLTTMIHRHKPELPFCRLRKKQFN